jgi:hypothetical protein
MSDNFTPIGVIHNDGYDFFPAETQRDWEMAHTIFLNEDGTNSTGVRPKPECVALFKLHLHGANPWVFEADARHFWQFAGVAEKKALYALTRDEHLALLGEWEDADWYPGTFGYPEIDV